ncbi:hypothetical protein CKO28_06100 [Rhodovibrio sodomensis]|uniref:Type I-F CRISPR-associated protein Csy1 n=1 Tax=Rhodovibrio sodomensis TaxID=1088 RepID=A0ABS1DBK6_9PROT|nr:hypothetical protein [Rhodovibrio sodomensis]MBK1667604.1 hypothetical protein [Rhodovibrio sodomensis]
MKFNPDTLHRDLAIQISEDTGKKTTEQQALAHVPAAVMALRAQDRPLQVAQQDVVAYCTVLLNSTGGAKKPATASAPHKQEGDTSGEKGKKVPKTWDDLTSQEAARAFLSTVTAARWISAVQSMGALAPKYLEPKTSKIDGKMPSALGLGLVGTGDGRYASALTTDARIRMTFCGNAELTRVAKVLMARVEIEGGEAAHVIELLADTDGALFRAFGSLGANTKGLEAASSVYLQRRLVGLGEVSAIDGDRMKCVFVPHGGGYLQVTPTPSAALFTEVPQRLRERRAGKQWIKDHDATLSSKPQNAGLHASYEGGKIRRIDAAYRPINTSQHWRKLKAVAHGAPFFTASMLRDEECVTNYASLVHPFLSTPDDAYSNRDIRSALEYHARSMAAQLIENLRDFQDFCSTHTALNDEAFHGPAWVRRIVAGETGSWSPAERAQIAQEMSTAMADALARADRRFAGAASRNDSLLRDLSDAAEQLVEETFIR